MNHHYPGAALVPDLLRAAGGLAVTGWPLLTMDLPVVAWVILGGLAVLFGSFALQVAQRYRTRVARDPDGLRIDPGARRLEWARIEKLVLAHFSVRRESREGWMELKLVAGGVKGRFDSRLDGFQALVAAAARAATSAGIELDPATVANLEALGIATAGDRGSGA